MSQPRAQPATPVRAAQLLLFLSGAAALAHQVLWTRRLVDVLGASSETFARVISAFFVGLALGGALAAWKPVAPERGWLRVAVAEFVVALLALPVLLAVPIVELARGFIPAAGLKLLLPFVLVLPPAVVMGLVFPAVAAALGQQARTVPLYLANTLGGILGIGALVVWLLPAFGTFGAGLTACAVNLAVALLAAWLCSRTNGHEVRAIPESQPASIPQSAIRNPHWYAFASGFLVLGLEVVLQHQFAQVTINSYFSGATVLVFVLLALVAAAALTGVLVRWAGGLSRALSLTLLATAVLCALQPFVFLALRPGLAALPYELPPAAYYPRVALLALAVMVPVFLVAGFTFPLLLRSLSARQGSARELAMLLAVNGVGGWLGAELLQSWLLPRAGLWGVMPVLALVPLAMAGGTRLRINPDAGKRSAMEISGFAAILVLVAICGGRTRSLPQVSPVPGERVVEVHTGREGVVATVNQGPDDWRIVFNNTYTLGGSKAQVNQERQGLLPVLLHGRARSVGLLGLATGSTTAGAALASEVERIEAVELSGLVIQFAREHLRPFNRNVFADPRVSVRREDARSIMIERSATYDVVIGDLFLPWRTGEGRLFAAEHFGAVHHALKRDGLFCQWLPLFQLTRPQFDTIVRTFRSEFPDAFLVRGDFYAELPIVGLVGGRRLENLDWSAIRIACSRLRLEKATRDPLLRHAEGVAMTLVGSLPETGAGPLNTLGNAWLEWDAGHNIVGLQQPWFIGVPCAEMIRNQHHLGAALLPPDLRAAHDAGQFFLTLSVADTVKASVLDNLKSQTTDRLPEPLRTDPDADWSQWPMHAKPFNGRPPVSGVR